MLMASSHSTTNAPATAEGDSVGSAVRTDSSVGTGSVKAGSGVLATGDCCASGVAVPTAPWFAHAQKNRHAHTNKYAAYRFIRPYPLIHFLRYPSNCASSSAKPVCAFALPCAASSRPPPFPPVIALSAAQASRMLSGTPAARESW